MSREDFLNMLQLVLNTLAPDYDPRLDPLHLDYWLMCDLDEHYGTPIYEGEFPGPIGSEY